MASSTVENYLKTLYAVHQSTGGTSNVPIGRLASAMGVVPGTATSMMKALADAGLVEYQSRAGVRLSPRGEQLALHVLRKHRLVELFLVDVLGLDWSVVHEEADLLEHAIVTVQERDTAADTSTIVVRGRKPTSVSLAVASQILVATANTSAAA